MLILVEYGPDVADTKKLIKQLGIGHSVTWLPVIQRREINCLLSRCDVGVGEFVIDENCIWGSSGWEVMAAGKPLLQSLNFTKETFEKMFSAPLPAISDVKSQEDVFKHLVDFYESPKKAKNVGKKLKSWFERFGGSGSAQNWANFIDKICLEKKEHQQSK